VNVGWDKEPAARKFVEENRLPFPVGHDSSAAIETAYKVDSTPSNFFIDKNGVLVERKIGTFEGDLESEFSQRIEKLLAQ
jgi:peroxiredoxin